MKKVTISPEAAAFNNHKPPGVNYLRRAGRGKPSYCPPPVIEIKLSSDDDSKINVYNQYDYTNIVNTYLGLVRFGQERTEAKVNLAQNRTLFQNYRD